MNSGILALELPQGWRISPEVERLWPALVSLRRDLHQHPELSGEERRTQAVVLGALSEAGVPARPIGRTGVLGRIAGRAPGPTLLLRADMDALPIEEDTGLSFQSLVPGAMHACGHDAHVAMLLGAAQVLQAAPPARGDVLLCFQPAEERGAGAAELLQAGLLSEPVDRALAFHVWSPLPLGQVGIRPGPAMASVDSFRLVVHGRGTHAATPEDGVDPIAAAAQIITAAQTLVARRIAPYQAAVLSFTRMQGGTTYNVLPEQVELLGTIRSFDRPVRDLLVGELESLAAGIARGLGARTTFEIVEHLPCLVNDPAVARAFAEVAAAVVGPEAVFAPPPIMGGEDFGLVLERVPGAMIWLGCGNPAQGAAFSHHHPRFTIDERVLLLGVELAACFARKEL